jgi:hypothetical protein
VEPVPGQGSGRIAPLARGNPAFLLDEQAGRAGKDQRSAAARRSKEGLFAEVVDLAYEKSLMMTPDLNAEAARELLTGTDKSAEAGMLLTLRSAANPRAAAIMRDSIERNYQCRLADALPGTDTASRAALLIAICAGVILDRMLLGHTELNSPIPRASSPTCTPLSTRWRRYIRINHDRTPAPGSVRKACGLWWRQDRRLPSP